MRFDLVSAAVLLLPALGASAPTPTAVDLEVYENFHRLTARDPAYQITVQECKDRKGFEFCVSGKNVCSSRTGQGLTKWESLRDSKTKCPTDGWTNNASIRQVKKNY